MQAKKTLKIQNRLGLHARAAAKLVRVTTAYECSINLTYQDKSVNAKSILGLLMLAAPLGSEVLIEADGSDAHQAVDALEDLFTRRFDEE